MGETRSSDGTVIRWRKRGSGPALVVVHGGRPTPKLWPPAEELRDRVTTVALGRRGYGFSDDGAHYSHQLEHDDIAAVLDAVGPPRWLYGSSSGAICALGAARHVDVERLILLEPPLPVDGPLLGQHLADMQSAVARGDLEEAVVIGLHHGAKVPDRQLTALRASSEWPERVARAAAWARDFAEIEALPQNLERYRSVTAPTLLLFGTETQPHHRRATEALASVLPSVSVVAIPGHGHAAAETAPGEVARAIGSFLFGSR